jgi:hypothetical protein
MEPNIVEPAPDASSQICAICHQLLLPEYYFCPNCGTPVHAPPLSTDASTQAGIYAHSVILPMILFLSISKWKGYRYFKSEDPKVKQVGTIATVLLIASTVITFYLAYVWTTEAINASVSSINSDMSI